MADPIPMVLRCPACGAQHLDVAEPDGIDWATRPHKTHLCKNTPAGAGTGCGHEWRPFEYATVGVKDEKERSMSTGRVNILDHGYFEVLETWGSDEMIVETARMSTGKGFLGWGGAECEACRAAGRLSEYDHLFTTYEKHEEAREQCGCKGTGKTSGDEKFLRFLYEHRHSTPFEFAGATIEVQAPLMVFREWHRHRTQSYSERSARYAPLPPFDYMPTPARVMANTKGGNKQAGAMKGADELTIDSALEWRTELAGAYEHCERVYQSGLRRGVPKELARLANTVGRYSAMRATTDLRNWLGFTTLRCAPDAQQEIRLYADAALIALRGSFPRTVALFEELRRGP